MYAVIFRATIKALDEEYQDTAEKLRNLALDNYGCLEFCAYTEQDQEVAISYWQSEEQIRAWKQDPLHLRAQQTGRKKWYKSYQVQVVEVVRQYTSTA